MSTGVTGTYLVRALLSAFDDAHRVLPRTRDRAELRRHALKLRFWPDRTGVHNGQLMDLDWSWIQALRPEKIGELRIHDTLGDCDNLRVIFFVGPRRSPGMSMLWVIAVLQKKSNSFSRHQIKVFKDRKDVVMERFY